MGWWSTERGIGGDGWADIFDNMLARLGEARFRERKMTMAELADLVEFCTRGQLVVEVRDAAIATQAISFLHEKGSETIPNRGQIHCKSSEGKEQEMECLACEWVGGIEGG